MLVLALKMGIFGEKLESFCTKKWWYDIPVHVDVR
jgi:hypothetical protein